MMLLDRSLFALPCAAVVCNDPSRISDSPLPSIHTLSQLHAEYQSRTVPYTVTLPRAQYWIHNYGDIITCFTTAFFNEAATVG